MSLPRRAPCNIHSNNLSQRLLDVYRVSANTGRISVVRLASPPSPGGPSLTAAGPPLFNFSTDELEHLLQTRQQQHDEAHSSPSSTDASLLRGTVFEPMLSSPSLSPDATLSAMQAFVRQWTPLRAYDKKVRTTARCSHPS